ncbi:unnamed protein product [Lathyrus sativus]|nr:unnamed protein product [Lathyrus sativus]
MISRLLRFCSRLLAYLVYCFDSGWDVLIKRDEGGLRLEENDEGLGMARRGENRLWGQFRRFVEWIGCLYNL